MENQRQNTSVSLDNGTAVEVRGNFTESPGTSLAGAQMVKKHRSGEQHPPQKENPLRLMQQRAVEPRLRVQPETRVSSAPEGANFQPTLSLSPPRLGEGSDERGGFPAGHRSRSGDAASRSALARPRPSNSWRRGRVAGSSARFSPRGRKLGSTGGVSEQLEIFQPELPAAPRQGPVFPAARRAWAAVEGQRRRSGKRHPLRHDLSRGFESTLEAPSVASGSAVEGLETSLFDAVVLLGSVLLFGSLTWLAV